jgi:hypothetical protein
MICNYLGAQSIMFQKGFGISATAVAIRQMQDSGYVLTGSDNVLRPMIIRTDKLGIIQWTKYYSATYSSSTSIERTADGGFIVAGMSTDSSTSKRGLFAMKTDAAGNVQWSKRYFSPTDEVIPNYPTGGIKIKPAPDSGYVMISEIWDINGNGWYQVNRLNSFGNVIWTRDVNKNNKSSVFAIEFAGASSSNGFVIVGEMMPFVSLYNSGILVTRFDDAGNMIWTRSYFDPNASDQGGYDIKRVPGGGYISLPGKYGIAAAMIN